MVEKEPVQIPGLCLEYAAQNVESSLAEAVSATSGDRRIGIPGCVNDRVDSSLDNGFCARGSPAIVVARLQRDIHGAAGSIETGVHDGLGLCMSGAGKAVVTLTHDVAIAHEYGTHGRIGSSSSLSDPSELQRPSHVPFVHCNHTGRSGQNGRRGDSPSAV
jgi:hypothetical protein